MSRIAKADVNAALTLAAKNIIKAGGADGRTSRAEMKAALAAMPKEHRALADIFFKFVDARDFKAGAQVTAKDVNKAVAYAKEHMIAKYDLNSNGLSKDEVAKMSLTGRNAVALAKALKAAGATDGEAKLNTAQLDAFVSANKADAWYISESDYLPQFITSTVPAGHDLNAHNVMTAFTGDLKVFFEDQTDSFPSDFTAEVYTAREARAFLTALRTDDSGGDEVSAKSAVAFAKITKGLQDNLTDLKVVKIGPKEGDGSLASAGGLYAKLIIGRTADGKVAGILLGSVET